MHVFERCFAWLDFDLPLYERQLHSLLHLMSKDKEVTFSIKKQFHLFITNRSKHGHLCKTFSTQKDTQLSLPCYPRTLARASLIIIVASRTVSESIVQTCVAQRRRITALPKHQPEVQLLSVVSSHCIRDLERYLLLFKYKNKQVRARANATILQLSASVTLVDKTEMVSKPGTHGPKRPFFPQKLVRSSFRCRFFSYFVDFPPCLIIPCWVWCWSGASRTCRRL